MGSDPAWRDRGRGEARLPRCPSWRSGQRGSRVSRQVNSLMKATVLMRQPGRVQEIVGALRRGGGDRLQVPGCGARSGRAAEGCLSCGLPVRADAHAASLPRVSVNKQIGSPRE